MAVSEEFKPKVAQTLSHSNKVMGILGSGQDTVLAAATNVATAQALLTTAMNAATVHESDRRVIERFISQTLPRANALGIFTDTDIAAANTYALWRTGIQQYDTSLPTNYESSLEDD